MGFYAERVFPWILDKSLRGRAVDALTREALAPLAGDVLEIGFGSGRTLPHYPAGVASLAAAEPSAGMVDRARNRAAAARFPVDIQLLAGEKLPFADARFDGVAAILVFCTVTDVEQVAREAYRVLKPGGTLCFLEHVLSGEPGWQKWQYRLNPLQRVIGCGCNLIRDPVASLERAGFSVEATPARVVPGFPGKPELTPIRIGVALKPRS